jgi:hypothetical protein
MIDCTEAQVNGHRYWDYKSLDPTSDRILYVHFPLHILNNKLHNPVKYKLNERAVKKDYKIAIDRLEVVKNQIRSRRVQIVEPG